jgi:uncharacterized protein (DUF3084 family)
MIGRFSHLPAREPRDSPRSTTAAALAGTAVVAILAVVIVALAYRAGNRDGDVSRSDLSALSKRFDERIDKLADQTEALQASVQAIQKNVQVVGATARAAQTSAHAASQQAKAALAEAKESAGKLNPELATCLAQIQDEIDDLQAYVAYRWRLRRGRVSGSCISLLHPRYG